MACSLYHLICFVVIFVIFLLLSSCFLLAFQVPLAFGINNYVCVTAKKMFEVRYVELLYKLTFSRCLTWNFSIISFSYSLTPPQTIQCVACSHSNLLCYVTMCMVLFMPKLGMLQFHSDIELITEEWKIKGWLIWAPIFSFFLVW
jgi:hypothetical protein